MYVDSNKIMFSEYCLPEEIKFCKKKLKVMLFNTVCKMSLEREKYIFFFWYSAVPISKITRTIQLSINAVVKNVRKGITEEIRKMLPPNHKSTFSIFSTLCNLKKSYNTNIGEKNMEQKCPHCGNIMEVGNEDELKLLHEIHTRDVMIENLKADNEKLLDTLSKLTAIEQKEMQDNEITKEEENNTNTLNTVENEITNDIQDDVTNVIDITPLEEEPITTTEEETITENVVEETPVEENKEEEIAPENEHELIIEELPHLENPLNEIQQDEECIEKEEVMEETVSETNEEIEQETEEKEEQKEEQPAEKTEDSFKREALPPHIAKQIFVNL